MTLTNTYQLRDFNDLIKVGTTLGRNWFRGHSKTFNNLTPGIFRKEYNSPLHEMFEKRPEQDQMFKFRLHAHSLISNPPEEHDFISWLFWLQHYGMPTRLLDWSESILIAAFFAVINDPNEDGEIWTMYPIGLNQKSGLFGLFLKGHPVVKYLTGEPFHNAPYKLLKELGLKEKPLNPIALAPPNVFPRMRSQMSTFTIHPHYNDGKTLEEAMSEGDYLVRYIIPQSMKKDFEEKLSYLGIDYKTIYPDLEGMALSFARENKYFGWGQPKAPTFD